MGYGKLSRNFHNTPEHSEKSAKFRNFFRSKKSPVLSTGLFMRTIPRGGLLPLGDHFLELLAGLELDDLLGLDVDGLLGLGIDALASSALRNFEGAEADELNLVALLEGGLEGVEHGLKSLLSGGLIQLGLLGNGLHEICFVHPD